MANRLKQADAFQLLTWVNENRGIATEKPYVEVTALASAALGIPLTEPNLRTAFDSLNIKRTNGRGPKRINGVEQLAIAILSLAEKSGLDPVNRAAIVELAGGELTLNLEQKV